MSYLDKDNNDFTQWLIDKDELNEELESIQEAEQAIDEPDGFSE